MAPRLLIIGLDCAEPSLVFRRWRSELPNFDKLMRQGSYGRLESCIPAITVPAWSCMLSGRDPGELGIYGFRNRLDRSYTRMGVADARAVRFPRLWDLLGKAGWRVGSISVPGSYPPPQVNGSLVSCFLAPGIDVEYTHPPELAGRIRNWLNGEDYLLDVPDFRTDDKQRILNDIYRLGSQRFEVAKRLIEEDDPELLMLVDMGTDRLHHAFWRHTDEQHPRFVENSPFANAIRDYYRHIDEQIGALLALCDRETIVMVVSDHGARPLVGGFCINEWLIKEGYLKLRSQPEQAIPLDQADIDWSQTRAWSAGGYYGRIFMNVQGREPEGIIPPAEFAGERTRLAARLGGIKGPDGKLLHNQVHTPQDLYRKVRGIAPDLIVYFSDLAYRAIGTVGSGELFTTENDTGPDDANHAQQGLLIFYDPHRPGDGQRVEGAQLYDILPTLLARLGIPAPEGLRGRVLEV